MLCPCHSKKLYTECCKPFHDGKLFPQNALLLMRSRYSAYAQHLADYIIQTTDPQHPVYNPNHNEWKKDIVHFCTNTEFQDLKILEFVDGKEQASVTFTAYLKQGNKDATFTEKSLFIKQNDRWLYRNGAHS